MERLSMAEEAHTIVVFVDANPETGEGVAARCTCGWSNLVADGSTLDDLLSGHDSP